MDTEKDVCILDFFRTLCTQSQVSQSHKWDERHQIE